MYEEIIAIPTETEQPFQVLITGISYCDGSYLIERGASDVHCLEYIVSGTGTVREDNDVFTASQGDVYLLHRGRSHRYFSDAADPWIKIWMNVCGPLSDRLLELYGLDRVNHIPAADGLEKPFRAFVENARRQHAQLDGCVPNALLFHDVLLRLSALLHTHSIDGAGSLASQIKREIDAAPDYAVTLDGLAQRLFCSKSHAIKVFREAYGITPYEYILQQKTQLAMLLLRNTSMPVGRISERLGFCDSHYFSGFFRSRVGKSPQQYRKDPELAEDGNATGSL